MDILTDFRELDAPLQRSVRRWWAGPGRLWLLAIAACGFLSVVSIFFVRQILNTGAGYSTAWSYASAAFANLMFPLAFLGCFFTLHGRQRILQQLIESAALPEQKSAWKAMFVGSLLNCWPVVAVFSLTDLLKNIFIPMFITARYSPNNGHLDGIMRNLDSSLLLVFALIVLATWMHCGRPSYLDYIFVGSFCMNPLLNSAGMLMLQANRLPGTSMAELPIINVSSGIMLALLMIALTLLARVLGRGSFITLSLLAATRSAELFTGYSMQNSAFVRGQLALHVEILSGWQRVFIDMPFSMQEWNFRQRYWTGSVALVPFWQLDLAVPIGPIGYLLAPLLNIVWLALVFLFCRWAVGRSAMREE
ncbi:hypothetical protein KDL44_07435 [bacterium]|nr:hypothetical protein [bacterium]